MVQCLFPRAADTAKVPVVRPIPSIGGQKMAVGLHGGPPIFRSGHDQARRLALLIPRVNEAREWLVGRAIIPEWMITLHHEHRQRVLDLGQPALDPRPPCLFELNYIVSDPEAPAGVV